MTLPLSGSRKAINLVVIQAMAFTLVIKGKVDYTRHITQTTDAFMQFSCTGAVEAVEVYDARMGELVPFTGQPLYPIFFENGLYEVIIVPTGNEKLTFYHEYAPFREAISRLPYSTTMTGNLHFQNEVGFSSFDILEGKHHLVTVQLEVFPTKLDYKKDYMELLASVNDEVYNLAYHFVKRTYLRGSAELFKDPTPAEFYRLMRQHVNRYIQALQQVEKRPHHQLVTSYEEVRGGRLRRQDSKGRAYLRKNAHKMVDATHGISVGDRIIMPQKGLLMKKQQTVDTHENRYVKYTMKRIISKLEHLKREITRSYTKKELDAELIEYVDGWISKLRKRLAQPLWREVGTLDRAVNSLVLQMGTGYREIFQIYVTLSKSIVLQGELYKIAMKDIATLYEYWTFLKLGRILQERCLSGDQNIIQIAQDGLFLNLKQNKTAYREFFNKETNEQIVLRYQYTTDKKGPTVRQKPDSMLSIAKEGKDYCYEYIFDAKYRLEVKGGQATGPKEEDINTMHRYRDSIVVERAGVYERRAFGAYVLFPWHEEEIYREHPLYRSIDKVNIGGLPFLPNATTLVEEVIHALLTKSADELQQEGILPIGAKEVFMYEVKNVEDGIYRAADVKKHTEYEV